MALPNGSIIDWLLQADVAIQYQVHRDLLSTERPDLQDRIATEGWGAQFLSKRNPNGHWGRKFYQPKWISTHYTLLDLRNLGISPGHPLIRESIDMVAREEKAKDGGILPIGAIQISDVCINGMFLNYASYFKTEESALASVVDCILAQHMPDGGFNCRSNREGAHHSSMHTTISVLEGFEEYLRNGYRYRLDEIKRAKAAAIEFLLMHQLYMSDRTGKVIHPDFLKLFYPYRWWYDILRALDFFQYAGTAWDQRMEPAIQVLLKKRGADGAWTVPARRSGQVHFDMEQAGKPSRWNTLRALRVMERIRKQDK